MGDGESLGKISTNGPRNDEGYVNVASELGMSGMRGGSSESAQANKADW